jgi:tetratricopeptide (TPR) repeat protein
MNASHYRLRILELAAAVALTACRSASPPTPPRFEPAESLLTIVAELQRYRDADLYRFPCPRDVSGQNVFKSTLVRMSNYETLYPQKYGELIAFTRAQSYARLGDYETAGRFCKKAQTFRGNLAARAADDEKVLKDFCDATTLSRQAESLTDFQRLLDERIERCRQLVARYSRPPWQSLAQCEWEQAEADLAEFLWANRQVVRDGPKRALDLIEAIRTRHRQSKNFYRHTLRLGDMAYELAAEYANLFPPERAVFLWDEFERWAAKARSHYLEVAQSFGAQERTEASARLAALEAFERRMRELNR